MNPLVLDRVSSPITLSIRLPALAATDGGCREHAADIRLGAGRQPYSWAAGVAGAPWRISIGGSFETSRPGVAPRRVKIFKVALAAAG